MPDLSGKVALVTGAARGIGRAIALELARGGADLVLCDLDTPHDWPMLEETGQLVRERGRDVLLQPCDVTVSRQVDELFAAALARFGRVDALVNNAGSSLGPDPVNNPQGLGVDIADTDDEYWRFFIDQNLTSAYYCCRAYVRAYRQAGLRSGSIVNMSSVAALVGANVGPAYPAAKAGLLGLTRHLAQRLGREGIRVNAVQPGMVRTRLTEKYGDMREAVARRLPLRRLAEPEDVASVVAFLVSDESRYVTGQAIPVDGGMTYG